MDGNLRFQIRHSLAPNSKVSFLRLTSVRGVHECIMQIRDITAQLKTFEVDMFEYFLMHYVSNAIL